jgi:hypothetical protein
LGIVVAEVVELAGRLKTLLDADCPLVPVLTE